jgi:hypothetical protein
MANNTLVRLDGFRVSTAIADGRRRGYEMLKERLIRRLSRG